MQRRAAAMYLAFFVIVGAAAYGLIATTSAPEVSVDGPTYANGESVTFDDRTYDLSVSSSGGELAWTNDSAVLSTTLDNGSTVPVTDVRWDGQSARQEATFEAGSTITYDGEAYTVSVNASAGSMTLTNADNSSVNTTVEAGGTVQYQGFEATVTELTADGATLVWGFPYLLDIHNEVDGNPTEATFVETRNRSKLVADDPALYDEITVINGTERVTFRANDTSVPFSEYFTGPERHTVAEGDVLRYQGNDTTIDSITNTTVTLTRPGSVTNTIPLSEGSNVTIQGTVYFAHFPDNSSVRILEYDSRYSDYRAELAAVDDYEERRNGLWGVTELSVVAVIILLATALLPVRG